jgi:rSAM/selenodomain-associated transferase 2
MKKPALSIVMPVLNEVQGIAVAVKALAPLLARGAELIIADGGSSDGTLAWAQVMTKIPGTTLVTAQRGRAIQMNAGAQQAKGDVLLFLHVDTVLPFDADALMAKALADGAAVWGRFDARIEGQSQLLPMVAACMNLRSRLSGVATGDQAMFMTKMAFDQLNGFPIQPLMEDIEMSKRLLKLSRPACLRDKVLTSGRRWDSRGALRTIALMWRLRFAYWRGVSTERLAEQYR